MAALFVAWSVTFIYRTSFIGIDGKRYYCLFDDAMVSMRYAWNLTHGSGLVWNEGERVEGFTNLLMTLYMAIGTVFLNKSLAVLFVQCSGIGFILASAFFNAEIAKEIFDNSDGQDFFYLAAFAVVLVYYPLIYWSLMGMETGLQTLLLLAATWLAIRSRPNLEFAPALPCLMGLSFLTRQDMLIAFFVIYVFRGLEAIKQKRINIIIKEAAIFSAFAGSLILFRWRYYGELVPNTYALKLGGVPLMIRFWKGIAYIGSFMKSAWPAALFAFVGLIFQSNGKKLLLFSLFISSLLYQVWIGGDAWNYWRMISPFMPLLFILCLCGILYLLKRAAVRISGVNSIPLAPLSPIIVSCVLLAALAGANSKFLKEMFLLKKPFYVNHNRTNVNIAIAVNEICAPEASIAVVWAGAIPYYTGRKSIDLLGKADKYIAHLPPHIIAGKPEYFSPGHVKHNLNYSIRSLRPTFLCEDFAGNDPSLSFYIKQNYERIIHNKVTLWLRKDSKGTLW